MIKAIKIFDASDQQYFAELSGDYNPLHVDPVIARRLLFGREIVHGIHVVLWALNTLLTHINVPIRLTTLKISFNSEMAVCTAISCHIHMITEQSARCDITNDRYKKITLNISWESYQVNNSEKIPISSAEILPCIERTIEEVEKRKGQVNLYLDNSLLKIELPFLYQFMPRSQLAILLAISRLVGHECPGYHSILSSLDLNFYCDDTDDLMLDYAVTNYRPSFSLLTMEVNARCLNGIVKSFFRPTPIYQPKIAEIKKLVSEHEFEGQRALVIGGSRGLGEVTVKALAVGGADIRFSYFKGEEDANNILSDVKTVNSSVHSFYYNVLLPEEEALNKVLGEWCPTHVYYFSGIFPYTSRKTYFNSELFFEFYNIYVSGFSRVINLLKDCNKLPKKFFYPSTIAIDELPADHCEYTAAKILAEHLILFFSKHHPNCEFFSPRLPLLLTDQNVKLTKIKLLDPCQEMLKQIRKLNVCEL